jgi:hypothetical protein
MPIAADHKAKLYKVDPACPSDEPGNDSPQAVLVQFNPSALSYSVQNTLEKKGRDANAKQHVAQTTAKLEFDLSFDNTHDGADVRRETDRIKQFLNPGDKSANPDQAPPLVGFTWGTFRFKGIVESFKETLDFFSSEGVPLRSTLKIALAAQDPKDVFADVGRGQGQLGDATTRLAAVPPRGVSDLAARGGNPAAARALGAANGLESLRSGGSVAALSAGVELKAGVAFSAGISAGISAGLAFGAGAGATASAGPSATLAPFSGLGTPPAAGTGVRLDAVRAQGAAPAGGGLAIGGAVALGGRSSGGGGGGNGLKADVGIGARIRFD